MTDQAPADQAPTDDPIAAAAMAHNTPGLIASSIAVQGANPDTHARTLEIAKELGIPSEVAVRNPSETAQAHFEQTLRALQTTSPHVAEWAWNPDNLAIAKDDLPALTDILDNLHHAADSAFHPDAGIYHPVNPHFTGTGTAIDPYVAAKDTNPEDVLHTVPIGAWVSNADGSTTQHRDIGLTRGLLDGDVRDNTLFNGLFAGVGKIPSLWDKLMAHQDASQANDVLAGNLGHFVGKGEFRTFVPTASTPDEISAAVAKMKEAGTNIAIANKEAAKVDERFPMPDSAYNFQQEKLAAGGGFSGFGKTIFTHPADAIGWLASVVPEMGVQFAPSIAAGAVSGPGAIPVTAANMFAIERANGLTDYLQQHKIDPSNIEEVRKAMADPTFATAALGYTNTRATIMAATTLISGAAGKLIADGPKLLAAAPKVREVVAKGERIAASSVTFAAGEKTAQEATGTDNPDAVASMFFLPPLLEGMHLLAPIHAMDLSSKSLWETSMHPSTSQPLRLASMMELGMRGELGRIDAQHPNAFHDPLSWMGGDNASMARALGSLFNAAQSQSNAIKIAAITGAAQKSKTIDRSPTQAEALFKSANQNGPSHVFIDANEFVKLFQSPQEADAASANFTGEPKALSEALAGNGDIAIPMERYVARVAKSKQADQISEHARLDPENLSRADLASGALDNELAAAQIAGITPPDNRIVDHIQQQLEAAGVEKTIAARQATLTARAYTTIEARGGSNAFESYMNRPIEVVRGNPSTGEGKQYAQGDASGFNAKPIQPDAVTVSGIHYSRKGGLTELDPAQAGSGAAGGERKRFGMGTFGKNGGTSARVAFYVRGGDIVPQAERAVSGAGGMHAYETKLRNMYDISNDPRGFRKEAGANIDHMEELISEAGFDGFVSKKGTPGIDHPVAVVFDIGKKKIPVGPVSRKFFQSARNPSSVAESYMAKSGLPYSQPKVQAEVDAARGKRIADAYDAMLHDPSNPEVAKSYNALVAETNAQYEHVINETGLQVQFIKSSTDPYNGNPHGAIDDIRNNNHLWVFSTKDGFGSDEKFDASQSPLLVETKFKTVDGDPMLANDVFRVVHDYFGHAVNGNGFRASGEENAWRSHSAMFSPEARRAMTSETRGQNSWVNFGPHGKANRTAKSGETIYADQKTGLLPDWVAHEGAADGPNHTPVFDQPGKDKPRGSISFMKDRVRITLSDTENLSTFIHETGHFFHELLADEAAKPDAPQQIKDDYATMLKEMGVSSREEVGTPQHEQMARSFEAYVHEGKAPSPELVPLFSRMRAWMLGIYRSIEWLNVTLSDDLRAVFDRMLATDDEIAAASAKQKMEPLADAKTLGMSAKEYERYLGQLDQAHNDAVNRVQSELMRAHNQEFADHWKEEAAGVREQVDAEIAADPAQRAVSILKTGKMVDGSDAPEGLTNLRLSKKAVAAVDPETRKELRGMSGKDGVSADDAAAMLGYSDGAALIRAIADAPHPKAFAKAETLRRMRAKYPDPLTDGSLPSKAMDALHNDRRAQVLQTEMEVLAKLTGQPAPKGRILSAVADSIISGKTRRDINPNAYLVAERKAANEAAKAALKNKLGDAFTAKRAQALNSRLYAAALKAVDEHASATTYLKRFVTKKKREQLGKAGGSYLDQIDSLMGLIELRHASSNEIARRQSLTEWLQTEDGRKADIPASVVALTKVTNLRDMTMDQARGLVDAVKQINHLARLETELMIGAEKRDRAAIDAELANSVRSAHGELPDRTGDKTRMDSLNSGVQQITAIGLSPSVNARALDGLVDGGPVWTHTVAIIQHAENNLLHPAILVAEKALADIYERHYSHRDLRALDNPVYRSEVKDNWSKARILSLALIMGTEEGRAALFESNRQKITPDQAKALLSHLDARDAAFVHDVWGYVGSFWDQIAETYKRRQGMAPEMVQASPFKFAGADGQMHEMTGGYYPLSYDSERSSYKVTQSEQDNAYEDFLAGTFIHEATADGFSKARVGSGGKSVNLDLDLIQSHARTVLRSIHLGDAVNYVAKVLRGNDFTDAVNKAGMKERITEMHRWLKDVAIGEMGVRVAHEYIGVRARRFFTSAKLAYKLSVAVMQWTGIAQTIPLLGGKYTLIGLNRLLSSPKTIGKEVNDASPLMRRRSHSVMESIQRIQNVRDYGIASRLYKDFIAIGGIPIERMQRPIDLLTWLGAEQKGLDIYDGDVARARAYADDLVERAQGSANWHNKTALQRGTTSSTSQSEWVKASTALMGYMIAKSGIAYEVVKRTDPKSIRSMAAAAGSLALLMTLDGVITALLHGNIPADSNNNGTAADEWLKLAAQQTGSNVAGVIPIIGPLASSISGYDHRSPVSSMFHDIGQTYQQIQQGQPDLAAAKALINLAGDATGLPSGQANTMIDAAWRAKHGEHVNWYEYLIHIQKQNSGSGDTHHGR